MWLHQRHLIRWYFFLKVVHTTHLFVFSSSTLLISFNLVVLTVWFKNISMLNPYFDITGHLFFSLSFLIHPILIIWTPFSLSLSRLICVAHFSLRTPPNLLLLFNSHTSCVSNLNSYSMFRLSVLLSVEIVKNSDPQDSYGLQRLHYFNWKGDLNSWNDNRCACRRISWMNLLRIVKKSM